MSLPPESIQVGRCYLANGRANPQIQRVIEIFPDGRLQYQHRPLDPKRRQHWRSAMTTTEFFAASITREVPCDWAPETGGGQT